MFEQNGKGKSMKKAALVVSALCVSHAGAGQVASRAALENMLGDTLIIEDFEGLSVHGGTGVSVPNPLSSDTVTWGMEPGVTYSSADGGLMLYGGYVLGEDSVVLECTGDLTIVFDPPQAALGFEVVNVTGNVSWTDEVTFYNGADAVGVVSAALSPGQAAFVGWRNDPGISSVVLHKSAGSQFGIVVIDNNTWGFGVAPCPADVAPPSGVLDLNDIGAFVNGFVNGEDSADIALPAGVLDLSDVNLFIGAFLSGCP